jgi:YVTN family beta-propeller protein
MDRGRVAGFWAVAVCVLASGSWLTVAGQPAPPSLSQAVRFRRPVAAAFLGDDTLCVANQRSGSVSLVDVHEGRVRDEVAVGRRPAGLAVLPDRKHVLVVDEERNELIALAFDGTSLAVRARLPVAPYPVSVAVTPDGSRATVASLWSRRVEVVDLAPLSAGRGPVTLRVRNVIPLPFAPRAQCVLPDGAQVVVADAFGGHLALVDADAGRLLPVRQVTGHNMGGLALAGDGKGLLISHQILDQHAPTTRENVEHGVLMANVVRLLPLDRLLAGGEELDGSGRLIRLDSAGDPAGLAVLDGGQVAVALGGVDQVALLRAEASNARRVTVGRRPTVLLSGESDRPLVVVNTLDDSLSLLDARGGTVTRTLSLGPQPEPGPGDRGEGVFYDARLALGGGLSCHSCHTDGHTNGLLADTLGDNTYGTPKRTLTLMGTALTDPWAWNGGMKYLHDQVRQSFADTMHSPSVTADQIDDLVSFLHTLAPPPPPEPVTDDEADRAQVERGRALFEEHGCVRCHIPPLVYTSHDVHDVGFADERGLRKFNPPSLRGVGQGYGFLHDNRAATLEEVFTKFHHKVGPDLPPNDLADLLRFLRSL